MTKTSPILLPTMVLVSWTMVMWVWMYWTRIPAILKMRMRLDPNAPRGEQMNELPAEVRWKADNYNHLMEQPTLFYAVTLTLAVIGHGDGLNLILAWIYVFTRIMHSFIQATSNNIKVRFSVFMLSSFFLIALIISTLACL